MSSLEVGKEFQMPWQGVRSQEEVLELIRVVGEGVVWRALWQTPA